MSCGDKSNCSGLCPCSFGIAVGIACAIFLAAFAWLAWCCGIGADLITEYGAIYYGYAPSFMGGIWGAIWGLIEGFIFGFIVAFSYNVINRCCKGKCCKPSEKSSEE